MRRAHLSIYRGRQLDGANGARGLDIQDRRRPDFLFPVARHLCGGRRVDDRQWLLQAGLSGAADGVRGGGTEATGRQPRGKRWVEGCQLSAISVQSDTDDERPKLTTEN